MSATESIGFDSVLGALPIDATSVLRQVAQKVVGQLMSEGVFSLDGGASPEDAIASSLGNWLSQAMRPAPAALPAGPVVDEELHDEDPDDDGSEIGVVEELLERNSALAAAVGACDCWGDDLNCPFCDGAGSAGWLPPDRRLFATYVYPAVRALTARRRPPRTATTNRDNRNNHNNHSNHNNQRKGPDR